MPLLKILENIEHIDVDIDAFNDHVLRILNVYISHFDSCAEDEIKDVLPNVFYLEVKYSFDILDEKLNQILLKIRNSGELGIQPINSFLSAIPIPEISDELLNKCYVVQAKLFIIMTALHHTGGFQSIINDACRAYRLLIKRKDWLFIEELPDFTLDVRDMLVVLEESKEKPKNAVQRNAFILLFRKYLDPRHINRQQTMGSYQTTKLEFNPKIIDVKPNEVIDIIDNSYTEYREVNLDDYDYNVDIDERITDQVNSSRFLSFELKAPNEIKKSLTLQNQITKISVNHIHRREKKLVTDPRNITNYDISKLIQHCFNSIKQSAEYTYILISLFIGRSLDEILLLHEKLIERIDSIFQGLTVLDFELDLPRHKFKCDEKTKVILEGMIENRPDGRVLLILPEAITMGLKQFPPLQQNILQLKKDAQAMLSKLNKKHSSNIGLIRIQNYLDFYLNHKVEDTTEIALLLGRNIKQVPGCYYHKVDVSHLINIHQSYLKKILSIASIEGVSVFGITSETTVGSQLQITKQSINRLFKIIKGDLEEYRSQGWDDFERFHNLYVTYCIHLLNLSTGHRPVCNPYETIDIFDMKAGTIFISDKESRIELSARVLSLPILAVEQMEAYISHLKNISYFMSDISESHGQTIELALSGKYPLFFFIEDHKILPVEPGRLEFFMLKVCPLPLNWHRHFMRTFLRQGQFSGQWVDAWMGHGDSSFSRYSGIAMADMDLISQYINDFLIHDIEFSVIQPWGHYDD